MKINKRFILSFVAPLHSSKFDPDERAIAVGIKVITESIVKLNNEKINKISK